MNQSYQAYNHMLDLIINEDMVEKGRLGHLLLGQCEPLGSAFG
jgi:hypothetical protein